MKIRGNPRISHFLVASQPTQEGPQQVQNCHFSKPVLPTAINPTEKIHLRHINTTFLAQISSSSSQQQNKSVVDWDFSDTASAALVLSGSKIINGTEPWALCYGGHQFGMWAGQLGDGRAISLFETLSGWDIQLKGAGITPYSRFADGRAVLRSSIREYLCAEAMHALGIPTSRSVSLTTTGELVEREELEPGAIVCRAAPSWIRFGSFEILYARQELHLLKQLADYIISEYYSSPSTTAVKPGDYSEWLTQVILGTADTIAHWQSVGFCHGVMNTDNMSILGLTIDYGPFQFMDAYDPDYICNHSDDFGRYSFANQPKIGLWNLGRLLVSCKSLLIQQSDIPRGAPDNNSNNDDEMISKRLIKLLDQYVPRLEQTFAKLMCTKFGFKFPQEGNEAASGNLQRDEQRQKLMQTIVQPFLDLLKECKADYTLSMRWLSDVSLGPDLSDERIREFKSLCVGATGTDVQNRLKEWWKTYYKTSTTIVANNDSGSSSIDYRKTLMRSVNPRYTLRNSIVNEAIKLAEELDDFSMFGRYFNLLQHPFEDGSPEIQAEFGRPVPPQQQGIKCSCSS